MNIMLEYYFKDVREPTEVQVKTNEYRQENDTNQQFVELRLEKKTGECVLWSALWTAYQEWCMDNRGTLSGIKKSDVKKYFEDKVFKAKENPKPGFGRGWSGWKLMPIDEELE
jgi:phage/plasmid-associated DNA primase